MPEINNSSNYNTRCIKFNELMPRSYNEKDLKTQKLCFSNTFYTVHNFYGILPHL
jgi:hypothetical protein